MGYGDLLFIPSYNQAAASTGAPVITGVPTISGTTGLGDTLTFTAASVTGDPTPTRTWQVRRDGSPVGSPQSGNTYEIVSDDLGTDITVDQIETNTAGSTSATSAATSIPAADLVGMTVRRSSDNAEEDINDDASGYTVESELTTHTGANSGFVTSWRDDSGNGNHAVQATSTQQPRVVNAGTVDEGVVFDGSNDSMTLTTQLSFAGEFTLACWAKASSLAGWRALIGDSGSTRTIVFDFGSATQITVRVMSNTSTFNHGVDTLSWNHFAITRNSSGKVDAYVNGGVPIRLFSDVAQVGTSTWRQIGAANGGSIFNGHLDEIYAADVALSEAEIAALMNGTEPASGTVLWLKHKPKQHGYTVRRSSDNAEALVLDEPTGYVDEPDLLAHVGANSGFLTSWRDDSGNGNHAVQATSTQQPRVVNAGTVDEGVVFDGVNDYLTAGARVTTGTITKLFVSAWVKATFSNIDKILVGEYITSTNNRLWSIAESPIDDSLSLQFSLDGTSALASIRRFKWDTNPLDGQWRHVAFYFNEGAVTLYTDGAIAASTQTAGTGGVVAAIHDGNADLSFGALNTSLTPAAFYNGSLDDIRIAEGTAADDHAANIAAIYAGAYEGSPTAWYKFKDQTP